MPFFTRKKHDKNFTKSNEKRKGVVKHQKFAKKQKVEKVKKTNEVISSDEDDFSDKEKDYENNISEDEETYQEKKLRLTKKYLQELEEEERWKQPAEDDTKDAVSRRLNEIALQEAGRLQKKVAKDYKDIIPEELFVLKGHNRSVTCLTISSDEKYIYSGSKDCLIIKWSLETGKKLKVVSRVKKKEATNAGHTAAVLSIDISSDNKFLVTAGEDKIINIWNPDTMQFLKTFKGHKDAIVGLTFNKNSHQLISASRDRSLKLWNLDEMGFVETLYGHQDGLTGIDSFQGETAITSGGRDNTVRVWKIVEESQLVFQGHGSSIDCVCVSSPHHFVSGSDDGCLCLWGLKKKKPLFKTSSVHGLQEESKNANWIVSVCARINTDLIASGSRSGHIKLWQRNDENNSLQSILDIPIVGFINALSFSQSGKYLVAALGQEHKFGRWWRDKEAKNILKVFTFPTACLK